MTLIVAMMLAGSTARAAPPAPPPPDTAFNYVVRPGDNLYTLAGRYFHALADYRTVQSLNRVRDPYRLRVGSTLVIPKALLRATPLQARLIAFRGAVTVGEQPAALAAPVAMGMRLTTGANASASIALPDGSTLTLPSQSSVRVASLQRYLINGAIERRFELEKGRTQSIVTPISDPAGTYRIVTPLSVSAVRGTDFRVTYDGEAAQGTSEVIGGHVAVSGKARGTGPLLAAGEGVKATPKGVGDAVALLKPPTLVNPDRIQDEAMPAFEVQPVAGAGAYRFQLSSEAAFLDVLAERTASAPRAAFDGLPDGAYFVRVSAIDKDGIEGLPGVSGFERRLNTLEASVEQAGPTRYLFRWRTGGGGGRSTFRLRLLKGDAGLAAIDRGGQAGNTISVSDLPPGRYRWQIVATQVDNGRLFERATPLQPLEVRGATPNPR